MQHSDPCTVSSYLFVCIKSYKYTLSIITSFRLGSLALTNREPITLRNLLMRARLPRPKSMCDAIIERVYLGHIPAYKQNDNLHRNKVYGSSSIPISSCQFACV